jgi:hypothetical protein
MVRGRANEGYRARRAYPPAEYRAEEQPRSATQYKKQQAWDSWDKVKDTLIGLGTQRVKDFLDQSIPGFREEYGRTESISGCREVPGSRQHGELRPPPDRRDPVREM